MLAIQPTAPKKCTPNLLPARINHNGPINNTKQYWKPETDSSGKQHAYFRGRHLHGTTLPLPENYTGAILHVTDKQLPPQRKQQQHVDGEEDEEAEEESMPVDVAIAEQVGEFEEVVIWGHGGEVDASQDMFIRGVTEWVGFAESMHCDGSDCDKGGEEKSGK